MKYHIELLGKRHNRADFCCGIQALDSYIQYYASQDIRRQVAATFVLLVENESFIAGYYTLSASSVKLDSFPEEISKKLPKYPLIPVTLLGRLAVDRNYRGQGWGEILLLDALFRSAFHSREIASMAVVVDAIDTHTLAFYEHFGFSSFPDTPEKLYLPMKTIRRLFPAEGEPNFSNC